MSLVETIIIKEILTFIEFVLTLQNKTIIFVMLYENIKTTVTVINTLILKSK